MKLPLVLCAWVGVVFATACTPPKSKAVIYTDRANDESCQYDPNSGDTVKTTGQQWNLQTFFFGKNIDAAKIEAAYHASAKNTVEQINAEGAEVLGVNRASPDKCIRFTFLRPATQEVQTLWQNFESSLNGKGGQIAGVFFPPGNKTLGVRFYQPTLVVGFDSNRYVVTHEYMHFLYDSIARTKDGYMQSQDLLEEIGNLNDTLGRNTFKKSKLDFTITSVTPTQNYKALERYLELIEKLLISYDLEEVAIEAKFVDDFSDGRYEWMPDGRKNSLGYMMSSHEKAQNEVVSIREFISAFIKKMEARSQVCDESPSQCGPKELAWIKENTAAKPAMTAQFMRIAERIRESKRVIQQRLESYNSGVPSSQSSHLLAHLALATSPHSHTELGNYRCPRTLDMEVGRVLLGE